MTDVETLIADPSAVRINVADRLTEMARRFPKATAVACPRRWSPSYQYVRQGESGVSYATTTFAELDADVQRIARGFIAWGVPPGTRLALLVRPGIEFVTLVFALLRAGIVIVLVDPGMGRRNLIRCLGEAELEGFIAISKAQAVRLCFRHKFPRAKWNVTVGRRWFWGGLTLKQVRALGSSDSVGWALPTNDRLSQAVGNAHPTQADAPAAIIFTSGSTGPPKGVLYTQRMFDAQVSEIQSTFAIEPGGVDLACFPLFALFNSAMGVTTVLPEMDFSRPAAADPEKLLTAANDWQATQAFASPAVWRVTSDHCATTGARIDSLKQIFSCGAPVPANVLRATLACVGQGAKMHTPYGATECLPVSSIEAAEVIGETARKTDQGAGVCVGKRFDSVEWRVIRITDEPLATIVDAEEVPTGEIGELIVRGPQVSPMYATSITANAASKICDGHGEWHRTGDVGYFDERNRFWYCGRKSQRVETCAGPLYTECVEAVYNAHPAVRRSALVGVGEKGNQTPVMIIEEDRPISSADEAQLRSIFPVDEDSPVVGDCFVVGWPLPVDIRHNAKINREKLAMWAATQLRDSAPQPHAPSP
jgi:olefin beta-lactone synthetase